MNNTDKLLRAFIEASGFDVKDGAVTAGNIIDSRKSSAVYSSADIRRLYPGKHIDCPEFGGNWIVSEPVTNYKVTKKKTTRELPAEERLNHATARMGQG